MATRKTPTPRGKGRAPAGSRSSPATEPAPPPSLRFAQIRGHDGAVDFLRRAWKSQRLAHAYFFTGPTGIGKLTTARALALGLHCDATPFEACGACAACRTIAAGTHADVRIILGPAENRRDISIDQIRAFQRDLSFRSITPHPKVGIINDAHLLTNQAQNALLKLLEEPPGDTVLILIGVNAATLALTILSRCQRVRFAPLTADDVAAVLETHGHIRTEAGALAAYAQGSPGRALTLDRTFFTTGRPAILKRLASLPGAGFAELAEFAQELTTGEQDLALVMTVIASWYRDGLRRQLLGTEEPLQNADLAGTFPSLDVASSLRNLETTYATMIALQQNANRNLALTRLLLTLER